MRAAAAHLTDPSAIPIALVAVVGLVVLGQPWWVAIPAGLVVLAVHLGSATWLARRRPGDSAEGARAFDWKQFGLTRTEIEIVPLVLRGLTYREIGRLTFKAERTIENHVDHIKKKLGAHSKDEIIAFAARHGLLGTDDPPGSGDAQS